MEMSKLEKLRESPLLATLVVATSLLMDMMLTTSVEATVPCVLVDIKYGEQYPELKDICRNRSSTSQNDTLSRITSYDAGWILGAKPAAEMFFNIITGCVVNRFGHEYPMYLGIIVAIVSTISLGYVPMFELLIVARIVQAAGTSLTVVAGLDLVSEIYSDDKDRANSFSTCYTGLLIGAVLGWPVASLMYELGGRSAPFLLMSCMLLLDGFGRMFIKPKAVRKEESSSSQKTFDSLKGICSDVYILITLSSHSGSHVLLALILTTVPAWMIGTLGAEPWQVGTLMAIANCVAISSQFVVPILPIPRWIVLVIGQILLAVTSASFLLCNDVWLVLPPQVVMLMSHSALMQVIPVMLARLVDLRHNSSYGLVYGLFTAVINFSLLVGSAGAGTLHKFVPLESIYYGVAAFLVFESLLSFALMNSEKGKKNYSKF